MLCKTIASFVTLVLLATLEISPAAAQGRGQGFRPCPYSPYVCPVPGTCVPGKITGKIKRVYTETLTEGMYPGMALTVETKERGEVPVHLGPVWFLERQEFELAPGQEVTIQGICTKSSTGKDELLAIELVQGDNLLRLRDSEGRPYWEAWRKR